MTTSQDSPAAHRLIVASVVVIAAIVGNGAVGRLLYPAYSDVVGGVISLAAAAVVISTAVLTRHERTRARRAPTAMNPDPHRRRLSMVLRVVAGFIGVGVVPAALWLIYGVVVGRESRGLFQLFQIACSVYVIPIFAFAAWTVRAPLRRLGVGVGLRPGAGTLTRAMAASRRLGRKDFQTAA